jgi:hypothetical protein
VDVSITREEPNEKISGNFTLTAVYNSPDLWRTRRKFSRHPVLALIYGVFFLSGAAALMYEVVWVRSLSLIFGGTHLAVTTVLSVFMGGLALGSFLIGKRVDAIKKPLKFYGFLELAIALLAVIFILLMKIYPAIYNFFGPGCGFNHEENKGSYCRQNPLLRSFLIR